METRSGTWVLVLVLALGIAGCDQGAGEDDLYLGGVPDAEMLSMGFDESESLSAALESTSAALVGEPSAFHARAEALMAGWNELVAETHAHLDRLKDAVTPVEVTQGAATCRRWEADGPKARWRFTSCVKERVRKRVAFVLEGRALDATGDAAWLPVLAGEGARLDPFEGVRRAHGHVGYQFDHLAELTGADVGGRLGVGFRIAGRARQIVAALDGLTGPESAEAASGVYRFQRVVGVGGRFTFVDHGDYLTRDAAGHLIAGDDGQAEAVRAAIAWKAGGHARTALAACGGTVGQGACARLVQCWDAANEVTHEGSFLESTAALEWEPATCPLPPFEVEIPSAGDETPPPLDEPETGAPSVDEPDPLPEE